MRIRHLSCVLALSLAAVAGSAEDKAADRLLDFLKSEGLSPEAAVKVADRYEAFRAKSEEERKKVLAGLRAKPKFAGRPGKGDLKKALRGLSVQAGPRVKEMLADKVVTLREQMEALREKSPKEYEAILDDAGKRAEKLKHCGLTREEDIHALEPLVYPGLEGRATEKRLQADLKAKRIDPDDALWVADQAPETWDKRK